MTAYIIALIDVQDAEAYKLYTAKTPGVIQQYGGRFVVRGGNPEALEGSLPSSRVVVLEFADAGKLQAFAFDQMRNGYYAVGDKIGQAWHSGAGLMKP